MIWPTKNRCLTDEVSVTSVSVRLQKLGDSRRLLLPRCQRKCVLLHVDVFECVLSIGGHRTCALDRCAHTTVCVGSTNTAMVWVELPDPTSIDWKWSDWEEWRKGRGEEKKNWHLERLASTWLAPLVIGVSLYIQSPTPFCALCVPSSSLSLCERFILAYI